MKYSKIFKNNKIPFNYKILIDLIVDRLYERGTDNDCILLRLIRKAYISPYVSLAKSAI